MFANGEEYTSFLNSFCERCSNYKKGAESKEESCPIEWQISEVSITGNKEDFPYNNLKPIGNISRYVCKNFKTDDEKLMSSYKKMFE